MICFQLFNKETKVIDYLESKYVVNNWYQPKEVR